MPLASRRTRDKDARSVLREGASQFFELDPGALRVRDHATDFSAIGLTIRGPGPPRSNAVNNGMDGVNEGAEGSTLPVSKRTPNLPRTATARVLKP